MAVNVQHRGARWQLRVTHALLSRPFFHTFDTEAEARRYGQQLAELLERGIVPAELAAEPAKRANPLLIEVIRNYVKTAPLAPSDEALLGTMLAELKGLRVDQLTFDWAEGYVRKLKTERRLAPSSIRKRVGSLARVVAWYHQRNTPAGQLPPPNVLQLLPRGYSAYSAADTEAATVTRRDIVRDRRLAPDELQRLRQTLAGVKREDRERALQPEPAFVMLVELILHTGMRLREAYRLRADQVDLERFVIDVEGSKGHRGAIKPRQVPISPALEGPLRDWCRGRVGLLFPFWDGRASELARTTRRLSAQFAVLFDYAGIEDFTEHDLRHEATCRWVEMRSPRGGWAFTETEICRLMGWSDPRMLLRYASLRGEDLAARMR